VSALGLGGWLTFGDRLDETESRRILDAARDAGITLLDLADSYANGAAERVVGKWLRNQDRSRFVVTSKVFWPTGPLPTDRGLGRAHVFDAIHRSLENLGTDYLDIYFCHREDTETPLEETARAMHDLVEQGKIRAWGTSLWRPTRLLGTQTLTRLRRWTPPRVEQIPYNVLERWSERRTIPIARVAGMGIFAFSPLANGLLSGKYATGIPAGSCAEHHDSTRAELGGSRASKARRFAELGRRYGFEPAPLALAWVLRARGVTSALMGASSVAQLEQNVLASTLDIPAELVREIDGLNDSE
jgi:aryl-alcohol dehydrogenase-like predicted oxidoreductase